MIVGRFLGWLLVLAGLVVLGRDLLLWWDTGRFVPIVLGQLWYDLSPNTLQLAQPAIQRHVSPYLWDPIIQTILLWWAAAVFLVPGLILLALFRRREPRRFDRRR
jgi:ABC-type Fe3+ transport system permease subunit